MTERRTDFVATPDGRAIVELVETGISLPDAVRFVGQSYPTVLALMTRNPGFSGAVDRARGYYAD